MIDDERGIMGNWPTSLSETIRILLERARQKKGGGHCPEPKEMVEYVE